MAAFDSDELRHAADKELLPDKLAVDTAAEIVQRFRQIWAVEKHHLPLADAVVQAIEAHAPIVPLYRELG